MPTVTPLDFEKEIREFRRQPQARKLPPINRSTGFENVLRADVSKYRPEVYKSEKSKILKKIRKVALGKLLT